jgi:Tol biopolymer transport system component
MHSLAHYTGRSAPLGRVALSAAVIALAACNDDTAGPATPTSPLAPLAARGGNGTNNGRILFTSDRDDPSSEIYSMNLDGSGVTRLTASPSIENFAVLSPDGKRVAFVSSRGKAVGSSIFVMNADGSGVTQLTFAVGFDLQPVWSKDGKKIAFASSRDAADPLEPTDFAGLEIYVMSADGSAVTRLTNRPGEDSSPSWSPDGKQLAFASDRDTPGAGIDVYRMNADGSQATRLTFLASTLPITVSWSSGGKQIAFATDQIFVVNADGTQLTQLTSGAAANAFPSWLDGGRRIVFASGRDGDGEIYSMNADGTGVTRLTINPATDVFPSGQR